MIVLCWEKKKDYFVNHDLKKNKLFQTAHVMVSHLSVRKNWHEMLAELFTAVDLLTKEVLDCHIGLLEVCLLGF